MGNYKKYKIFILYSALSFIMCRTLVLLPLYQILTIGDLLACDTIAPKFLIKDSFYLLAYTSPFVSLVTEDLWVTVHHQRVGSLNIDLIRPKKKIASKIIFKEKPKLIIQPYKIPLSELNIRNLDHRINRINTLAYYFPSLLGQGITISVKEFLMDTTDIDLRKNYVRLPNQPTMVQAHASIMATIIGGLGNNGPESIGVAPAVRLSSSSFNPALPDSGIFYSKYGITIQNHSYGDDVSNEYGIAAFAYDQSAYSDTAVLHVFSSGNRGNITSTAGRYQGISGMANLTGEYKSSKNTIAVGSINNNNRIDALSSRGPTFDGRIKPELVALSIDGTSGAAALVSGTAALVQQAFKLKHQGLSPSSSLVKAILINSAEDLGAAGPDHTYGFGKLNALQAIRTVESGRFIQGSISKNKSSSHIIQIPDQIRSFKITLVWHERPATIRSSKALLHDLNLWVSREADQKLYYPLILSAFPHLDSLSQRAIPGRDSINNIEQICISNPSPGNYEIIVSGNESEEIVSFTLVYEWEVMDHFVWNYPLPNERIRASELNNLQWQSSYADHMQALLEYSYDSIRWIRIKENLKATDQSLQWSAPDTNAYIHLRWTSKNQSYITSCFLLQDLILSPAFVCEDSVSLQWVALPGIDSYKVYTIQDLVMKSWTITKESFTTLTPVNYDLVSISPLIKTREGPRYASINYRNQGIFCYLKKFLAHKVTEAEASIDFQLSTIRGVQSIRLERLSEGNRVLLFDLTSPTALNYIIPSPLTQGVNQFILTIVLQHGKTIQQTLNIYSLGDRPISFYPNPARSGQPLTYWSLRDKVLTMILTDLLGRIIDRQESLISGSLDLPYVLPGVYSISFWDKKILIGTEKLVVY